MTKSVIKSMTAEPAFYADVFAFATQGFYFFDAQDWADALPAGNDARAITVTTDFTYQINNQPDYQATVGYRFVGDFSNSGGIWTGEIDKVQFLRDGDVFSLVDLNSGVDLSRVANVGGSGLIWNELTVTGLRGKLTGATDYFNGSLGDDILILGAGNDQVNASRGNDIVRGGGGDDLIDGFDGNDKLYGGGGNDRLEGKGGDDMLFGQAGRDTFAADSQGTNVWTGGKGADMFQASGLKFDKTSWTTVTDFKARQGDKLDLTEFAALLFNEADEVRFIGKRAFAAESGVMEIRMKDGLVSIDQEGDGIADFGLLLDGLNTFRAAQTGWIELPEWWDFS